MSFAPQARRFDPSRLFPAIETNGEDTFGAPNVSPPYADPDSTDEPDESDTYDEALEQVAIERCCVCPLCGAIVSSTGMVLS
jgi:hypothetical protein